MSYFINGSFVSEGDAKISVLDLGLLRGFGVFEYLRTYRSRPFHLEEHLQRLQNSAEHLRLPLPYPTYELSQIIHTLIDQEVQKSSSECGIKIILTGGVSSDQFMPQNKPSCIVFAYPHTSYPSYPNGIHIVSTFFQRAFPHCKTTQYLSAIAALQGTPAQEALYITPQGELLEGTTSNFFAVRQGTLYTSDSPLLLRGITRFLVLRLAQQLNIPISFDPLFINDIPRCDEAFITATNKEVTPVATIDQMSLKTGPITQRLKQAFHSYTQQTRWEAIKLFNLIL